MGRQSISIQPLAGAIGAEIAGVDLAQELDADTIDRVGFEARGCAISVASASLFPDRRSFSNRVTSPCSELTPLSVGEILGGIVYQAVDRLVT